jgi:primosomal protein N' (replication factor Y) (superfamily II helicase)
MPDYCNVVVDRPVWVRTAVADDTPQRDSLDNAFTYEVPSHLVREVQIGQIVEVPFHHSVLQGVIVGFTKTPPSGVKLRLISAILDPRPILNETQLTLARWMSRHYVAALSECVWMFVPSELRRAPETVASAVARSAPPIPLDAAAFALLMYLQQRGPTTIDRLDVNALTTLQENELVRVDKRLAPPRVGPLLDRTVELVVPPDEALAALPFIGRPSKQAEVLLYLASLDNPLPTADEVLTEVGCTSSVLKALEEKGLLSVAPSQTLVASAIPDVEASMHKDDDDPTSECAQLLDLLKSASGPMPEDHIETSNRILKKLEAQGLIRRWVEPKTVSLTIEPEQVLPTILELRGTKTEAKVLEMLSQEEGAVWVGWVYAQTDAKLSNLRRLAEADLVVLDEARQWRDPLINLVFALHTAPELTEDQNTAWRQIQASLNGATSDWRPFLIHGVTGSGKTEIYLRSAAEVLNHGKGVIFLVPEIALATQTIQRVAQRFPNKVAIWHSQLSPGERFDTWQKIREGKLPIVVGPRSALFTPVPDIGLIIVDEEHEPAYKHLRSPRIHGRDIALELARMLGATIILGSATPDVVSMRRAERGEFRLVTLPQRVLAHREHVAHMQSALRRGHAVRKAQRQPDADSQSNVYSLPLPPVEIISLSDELRAGNSSIFSRALQTALSETLEAKHQAILFLNRRGAATYVFCRDCGYVTTCPRCQTPLTYHSEQEALVCHHCGRRYPNPQTCPQCGSSRIRYFGLGTERVEDTVHALFPQARTLRWDRDTAQAKGQHQSILNRFASREADILIGTQMIAKGLDLPFVTLVGIISADTGLFFPDYRATERTFQLLTQVAGRAGRSPLGGRVILQTYHPQLPVIQAAALHDYETFYRSEMEARRNGRYPPFKRLARLVYVGSGADRVQQTAEATAEALRQHILRLGEPGVEIIGPAPCFLSKLRGQYRWHMVIRADEPDALLRTFSFPPGWQIDIDPTDFL